MRWYRLAEDDAAAQVKLGIKHVEGQGAPQGYRHISHSLEHPGWFDAGRRGDL